MGRRLQGAAYTFQQASSGWTNTTELGKLISSDTTAGDEFGDSIAVDGSTVVVGGHPYATVGFNGEQGAAYIFTSSGSGWADMTPVATLTAADGAGNEMFGFSVSISGKTVVVGSSVGTYAFTEPTSGWTSMTQTAELTPSDNAADAGFAVAIDGNTVVMGASDASPGGNYAEERPTSRGTCFRLGEHDRDRHARRLGWSDETTNSAFRLRSAARP